MSKPYPADLVRKLQTAVVTWKNIDPALEIGNLSLAELEAAWERCGALQQEINSLETQLTDLRNQRDEAFGTGWSYITRMRAGIKGIYGDDSSEYEMAGGTRRSERKPRSRRAKVQAA
jgi:uncharacterized small protein (DUF1192 family)